MVIQSNLNGPKGVWFSPPLWWILLGMIGSSRFSSPSAASSSSSSSSSTCSSSAAVEGMRETAKARPRCLRRGSEKGKREGETSRWEVKREISCYRTSRGEELLGCGCHVCPHPPGAKKREIASILEMSVHRFTLFIDRGLVREFAISPPKENENRMNERNYPCLKTRYDFLY
jgi:hypothetical protein